MAIPIRTVAALAAAFALLTAPTAAQERADTGWPGDLVRKGQEEIAASIVRIRTTAHMKRSVSTAGGEVRAVEVPLSVHGTGVVLGSIFTGGRWEYLVMTNHHVADVSNYLVQEGSFFRENRHNTRGAPRVHEESFLVDSAGHEMRLVEVARNVKGDMALLRTVDADRPLTPFRGQIGFRRGQVQVGATVLTSGFPLGKPRVSAVGTVVEVDRPHALGQPHEDYIVDLPLQSGQSGSPVFLIESTGDADAEPQVRLTLIGLLHAKERGDRFVVPYLLWEDTLAWIPGTLRWQLPR